MNELTCLILFDQPMKRLGYVWQNIPEISKSDKSPLNLKR